jgi:hypothetical protein
MPFWRSVTASVFLALSGVAAFGCTTGGAAPLDEDFYGDPPVDAPVTPGQVCYHNIEDYMLSDTGADSPTDFACHADCYRPCGFDPNNPKYPSDPKFPRAVKYCPCESGVYIECRCPRPDWYKGAFEAPYCDKYTIDGKGISDPLDGDPCPEEWAQCIGRDPVDGYTPRGCACFETTDGTLEWDCRSTEKWFYPEQSTIP